MVSPEFLGMVSPEFPLYRTLWYSLGGPLLGASPGPLFNALHQMQRATNGCTRSDNCRRQFE